MSTKQGVPAGASYPSSLLAQLFRSVPTEILWSEAIRGQHNRILGSWCHPGPTKQDPYVQAKLQSPAAASLFRALDSFRAILFITKAKRSLFVPKSAHYWDKNGTRFWPVKIASPMTCTARALCKAAIDGREVAKVEAGVRPGAGKNSIGTERDRHRDLRHYWLGERGYG